MYAIVKTGGKQYRVQQGQSLLIERLPGEAGDTVDLRPLLFVDGDDLVDGDGLSEVSVEATILAQERGPKLRIVKFKPKRGYKRRTGHRQELTRIEISTIGRKKPRRRAAKSETTAAKSETTAAKSETTAAKSATAAAKSETAPKPVSANPSSGADDGS